MEKSRNEITFIAIVIKFEHSFAGFLTVFKCSLISNAIEVPGFDAEAMIFIVLHLTFEGASFLINEHAEAIGLSILPVSLDDITIVVRQSALPIEVHILKLALEFAAVSKSDGSYPLIFRPVIRHKNCVLWKRYSPLTLIQVAFSNVYPRVIPSSIGALFIIVKQLYKFLICKERLIRKLDIVVLKYRVC